MPKLRIALDENFPARLVSRLHDYIPDAELRGVVDIDARMRGVKPDWKVVVALHHLGWPVIVTNDHHALDFPKTIAAVAATKSTFIAVEDTGADPLRAVGALLLELPGLVRAHVPDQAAIYRWHPRNPERLSPEDAFGRFLKRHPCNETIESLRRTNALTLAELRNPLT